MTCWTVKILPDQYHRPFSKKGYELAFGTDTIFDTQRDTRYHLSAPVNSTYRTLKEDTLKMRPNLHTLLQVYWGEIGKRRRSLVRLRVKAWKPFTRPLYLTFQIFTGILVERLGRGCSNLRIL